MQQDDNTIEYTTTSMKKQQRCKNNGHYKIGGRNAGESLAMSEKSRWKIIRSSMAKNYLKIYVNGTYSLVFCNSKIHNSTA